MNRTLRILIISLVVVVLVLTSFIGGFLTSNSITGIKDSLTTQNGQGASVSNGSLGTAVSAVYQIMKQSGQEPSSEETATIGALNGLLQSNGDTHSQYLPASTFKDYSEEMSGSFGGIGISMIEQDGTIKVVEVFPGSPAERAGIKPDDFFYTVGGETKSNWTSKEIQKAVKGKPGTQVTITMLKPYAHGEVPTEKNLLGKPYTVTITREDITYPNTTSKMLKGNIGYVKLSQFNQLAGQEVRKAVKELEGKGATSLILDLRNNPGGLITQAIDVTSVFVKSGPVVRTVSRKEGTEVLNVNGDKITDLPLVVLVNENSASASEIVAGALQDYKRGVLIGAQTFGKGSVQTQIELQNGGAILLTTAHYETAKGRPINQIGLTPEIPIEMNITEVKDEKTDTQLQRAIKEASARAARQK